MTSIPSLLCSEAESVLSRSFVPHIQRLMTQSLRQIHFATMEPCRANAGLVNIGQVRLGGLVRNNFSARTILSSTGCCKLPR